MVSSHGGRRFRDGVTDAEPPAGIKGTYVCIEPFHLFRYLDEQALRYNLRQKPMNDGTRFQHVMNHVLGHRLTYAQLTGKGTDALHHETEGAGPA